MSLSSMFELSNALGIELTKIHNETEAGAQTIHFIRIEHEGTVVILLNIAENNQRGGDE